MEHEDVREEWVEAIRDDHPNLHAVIRAANAAAGDDMGAFLCWLAVRVLEMHRILKPTGSLYLHIDHTAHAWTKAMMDAIFGRPNFRNEVVWHYGGRGAKGIAKQFARNHDVLLFYTKAVDQRRFERQYITRSLTPDEARTRGYRQDKASRWFKTAPRGDYTDISIARLEAEGRIHRTSSGKIRIKYFLDVDAKGNVIEQSLVGDTWNDIPDMMHAPKRERTNYPTQKPLALYERIVLASSGKGDMVLDPFAGCATTCVAAERLGRNWIAIDINKEAEQVTIDRLQQEAQLPIEGQQWDRLVTILHEPPTRTDNRETAAPELVLVSPKPRGRRMSVWELREKLIIRDGQRCQGCGWEPPFKDYLEVDHILPKSKNGTDDMKNRTLLCGPCNGVKGNRLSLTELRERRVNGGRMMNPAWDAEWYKAQGKYGTAL